LITSSILAATLPDVSNFKAARDLSAWLGLTPKPHSSGGKERLGTISRMGSRYIRRLLYLGASCRRHAFGATGDDRSTTSKAGRRRLALGDDAAQAGEAGRHRAGQPDGANGLGSSSDRRELSGLAWLRKEHGPDESDEMVRRVALKARLRREGMMAN
jgi:hypothetical protein